MRHVVPAESHNYRAEARPSAPTRRADGFGAHHSQSPHGAQPPFDRFEGGPGARPPWRPPTHPLAFASAPLPVSNTGRFDASMTQPFVAVRYGDLDGLRQMLGKSTHEVRFLRNAGGETLLLAALRCPDLDIDMIDYLLDSGACASEADYGGQNAFHVIVGRDDATSMLVSQLLGSNDAYRAINAADKQDRTVLEHLIRQYHAKSRSYLQLFVRAGMDLNGACQDGLHPLVVAALYLEDPYEIIDQMIGPQISGETASNPSGQLSMHTTKTMTHGTPMINLARFCLQPDAAMLALALTGASVSQARQLWCNVTALKEQIREISEVEQLFQKTQMRLVSAREGLGIDQNLREFIASFDAGVVNRREERPIRPHDTKRFPPGRAAKEGLLDYLRYYLSDRKDQVRGPDSTGLTPLCTAAVYDKTDSIKVICEGLAREYRTTVKEIVNEEDRSGMTPLMHAIKNESHFACAELLRLGADPCQKVPKDLLPSSWQKHVPLTAIAYAASLDNGAIIRMLCDERRPNVAAYSQDILVISDFVKNKYKPGGKYRATRLALLAFRQAREITSATRKDRAL